MGAFNLIRRPVYEALGGYAELRMEVLEDMRLGFRAKREGYAQRVAFGKDLVRIRWAESAWGILNNLTKNLVFHVSISHVSPAGSLRRHAADVPDAVCRAVLSRAARWAGIVTLIRYAAAESSLLAADEIFRRFTWRFFPSRR